MPTRLPSSEPSAPRAAATALSPAEVWSNATRSVVGAGEARQVVGLDADAGAGQPAAALHQRGDLLEERGQRGVAVVGLGVEPGGAAAELAARSWPPRRWWSGPSSSAPSRSTLGACRTMPTAGASPRSNAMNPSVLSSFRTSTAVVSSSHDAQPDELLVGGLDGPERLDEELGHLLVGVAAGLVAELAAGGLLPVVEHVAVEAAHAPERDVVARVEGLADHRHVGAGGAVEPGPVVGPRHPVAGEGADRHRRPAVREHRQRPVLLDRRLGEGAGRRRPRAPRGPTRRRAPTRGPTSSVPSSSGTSDSAVGAVLGRRRRRRRTAWRAGRRWW